MLNIKKAQVEVFSQASLSDYIERIYTHFCDPSVALLSGTEKEASIANIDSLIDKAEDFDIDTEEEVQQFVEFGLKLGLNFTNEHDWAITILQDEYLLAEEKIKALAPLVNPNSG